LDTETVEQALMERSGLILLTGAPRSGKQSTMAALIAHLNTTRSARIISLERNIQFWHHKSKSTIIQREIGIDTKSFSHGIQQAVLQDPDVIALSELPDRETAEFAIRAAAGGHLVLAAIDASSSVRGLERIIDTFTKSGTNGHKVITSLANSLRLVLAQTLVPRADAQGMLPAFEILTASEAVRRELHEGRAENLSTIMRDENMQTLGKALAYLVSAGTVSRQDALGFVDTLPEIESQPAQPQPSSPAPAAGSSEPTDMLAWL
ncbi:Flp pilus assembly complex ATPase component TadA, partial [bacterium]|nr:Flp pilus assembly complex ATPase component TadA [bacterium]